MNTPSVVRVLAILLAACVACGESYPKTENGGVGGHLEGEVGLGENIGSRVGFTPRSEDNGRVEAGGNTLARLEALAQAYAQVLVRPIRTKIQNYATTLIEISAYDNVQVRAQSFAQLYAPKIMESINRVSAAVKVEADPHFIGGIFAQAVNEAIFQVDDQSGANFQVQIISRTIAEAIARILTQNYLGATVDTSAVDLAIAEAEAIVNAAAESIAAAEADAKLKAEANAKSGSGKKVGINVSAVSGVEGRGAAKADSKVTTVAEAGATA